MTDETRNTSSDDAIGALVRLAGRRPQVPEDAMARVREAVHAEWMETMGRRNRMRWIGSVAAVGNGGPWGRSHGGGGSHASL